MGRADENRSGGGECERTAEEFETGIAEVESEEEKQARVGGNERMKRYIEVKKGAQKAL